LFHLLSLSDCYCYRPWVHRLVVVTAEGMAAVDFTAVDSMAAGTLSVAAILEVTPVFTVAEVFAISAAL
jgi:hypothetical protein